MNRLFCLTAVAALTMGAALSAAAPALTVSFHRLVTDPPLFIATAIAVITAASLTVWRVSHRLRALISVPIEQATHGLARCVAPLTGTPELTSFG